jgi:succinoglycan biosynthesis protein ExoM
MSPGSPQVVIAVLTYRRPDDIVRAIAELLAQTARVADQVRILVIDNDPDAGARPLVEGVHPQVAYVHEPVPGIAAGRNRALDESTADDLLIFFDDDEAPSERWLELMLSTWRQSTPEAVVGSVVSDFEIEPDAWVTAGRFFDRRRLATGTEVGVAATNNLLLDLDFVRTHGLRFDARYGISGGSDTLFTRQLVNSGGRMVWCDEAVVIDKVPAERVSRDWVLRRAYRSGNSWSRTSLELRPSRGFRRVPLLAQGAVRIIGGMSRACVVVVMRDIGQRARGRRTMSRGAGMVTGALGRTYLEYARPSDESTS